MAKVVFKFKYENYNGTDGLILSPSELLEQFFHGIPICTADGREITQNTIKQKIRAATEQIEDHLMIKLGRQFYTESADFILDEWKQWGYMSTSYQIREVTVLSGMLGGIQQVEYPVSWSSVHLASDEKMLWRRIHLVPAGKSVNAKLNTAVAIGITPHAGFLGVHNIPNYWDVTYCTGFDKIPANVLEALGKIAAISLFAILGDILLGAGIASQSLSYDGLSESITTTQSAENSAYSARIRQYLKELKPDLKAMRDFYVGIRFQAL